MRLTVSAGVRAGSGEGEGLLEKWGVTERAPCPEILVLLGDMGLGRTHAGSKSRVGAQF